MPLIDELPTIILDQESAREKLQRYKSTRPADSATEFAAAEAMLKVAAGGGIMIDVAEVMRLEYETVPLDETPTIAIARADRDVVRLVRNWRSLTFDARSRKTWGAYRPWHSPTPYPQFLQTFHVKGMQPQADKYARVPMVPAEVRRRHPGQLREWHVLWEVDQWFDSHECQPPWDPILLVPVVGHVWEVLDSWDLTEIERAAMRNASVQ